jgi:transposase
MEHYVGLDVSLKSTAICVVDAKGKIVREGATITDPQAIAAFIASHAPNAVRIGLESGATSTWLWTELNQLGLPVICIDARHAKAALNMTLHGATSWRHGSIAKTPGTCCNSRCVPARTRRR